MAEELAFAEPEWAASLPDAYRSLPPRPGVTAVVEHTATGGPAGEVSYWTAFEDGRLVGAGAGRHDAPTVTLTSPYTLARQLAVGDADPSVTFMQGRTKVAGDQKALLRVLAMTATSEYRAATAAAADRTAG